MLVVYMFSSSSIDLLNFINQIRLNFILTQNAQNIVRVDRPIGKSISSGDGVAFPDNEVFTSGNTILMLRSVGVGNFKNSHTPADAGELHNTIDVANGRAIFGFSGLKQLCHSRKTKNNVLGFGYLTRDFRQNVPRGNHITVMNGEVCAS